MRKSLLIALFALSTVANAQVLESDNYESYTLGNVGTDFTGATAGQGGMYLYNGAAADYQIVSVDTSHGKSIQLKTGATATAASSRYVWKDGLADAWAARTSGNDYLVGTLKIYTGTSTGVNRSGSLIFGDTSGIIGISYNSSTKQINGLAYLTPTGTGTAGFYNITGLSTTTYAANTWISVGYSYDYNTGDTVYILPDGTALTLSVSGYTTVAGLDAAEHDIYASYATGNTASTTTAADDYQIVASSEAVLGVKTVVGQIGDEVAVVYPNPVSDYLNISYSKKVTDVAIYDASGKVMNLKASDNKVDVRNLEKGVYIINMKTPTGIQTQKFIKK